MRGNDGASERGRKKKKRSLLFSPAKTDKTPLCSFTSLNMISTFNISQRSAVKRHKEYDFILLKISK